MQRIANTRKRERQETRTSAHFDCPDAETPQSQRPKIMDNIQDFPGEMTRNFDGHDVKDHLSKSAFPVYLGDVWQPGPDPPDFVGTMLIIDTEYPGNECPRGVPCFMRNEAETAYTGILTVTPGEYRRRMAIFILGNPRNSHCFRHPSCSLHVFLASINPLLAFEPPNPRPPPPSPAFL